jgi:H/ACA ribonucleoprotein complex subunit 2
LLYSIFTYRVVFIAGDISPIDVVTHLPVLCEDHNIPYVFVPSKEDLGSAGSTKRPTSVIMVSFKKDADYADAYKEVYDEVKELNAK